MATTITVYTNKDTGLRESEPDTNYGSNEYIYTSYGGAGLYTDSGIFGFDLTGLIPSQNIIKSMEFHCYIGEVESDGGSVGINLAGSFTDWNESTATQTNTNLSYYSTGGGITVPQAGAWYICSLPSLIPYINALRPNQVTIAASPDIFCAAVIYAKEHSSGAYRAYLTITHDVGYVPKLAPYRGSINKTALKVYIAATQGAINKQVIGMKAAVTQGEINKTVF